MQWLKWWRQKRKQMYDNGILTSSLYCALEQSHFCDFLSHYFDLYMYKYNISSQSLFIFHFLFLCIAIFLLFHFLSLLISFYFILSFSLSPSLAFTLSLSFPLSLSLTYSLSSSLLLFQQQVKLWTWVKQSPQYTRDNLPQNFSIRDITS